MERTTQQVLSDITEIGAIIGTEVIMEYVNKQNAACDKKHMSSAAGTLEKVTEAGVELPRDYVPFAGKFVAICSIKQIGNNELVYENKGAYRTYTNNALLLSEKQMDCVEQQGKWVY